MLPAASVARTANECAPTVSPVYCFGELQAAQAPVGSRRHSNVEPASLAPNTKLAEVDVVDVGGLEVIDVSGGVVSGGGGAESVPKTLASQKLTPHGCRAS